MMFLHKISALLYDPLDYIKQIKLRYFVLFTMLLIPGFAQAGNLFDLPAQDVSVKMLQALFGGLVETKTGLSNDPILEPIKSLNSGALIVGGILAAYTILAGTVGTAHDGEMLGKKLSSVWVPIRYSIGTALVLPVISGGYCVIQLLVMWVIIQGIGLAGSIWSSYIATASDMVGNNAPSALDLSKIEDLTIQIIAAHACNRLMSQEQDLKLETFKNTSGGETANNFTKTWGVWDYKEKGVVIGKAFGTSNMFGDSQECGYVKFPTPEKPQTYISKESTYSGFLGTEVSTAFAPIDVSPIVGMHKAQTLALIASLEPQGHALIDTADFTTADAEASVAAAKGIAQTYISNIKSVTDGINNSANWNAMKTAASEQGWMLAGAWFTRILIINNNIRAAMTSYPVFTDKSDSIATSWLFGRFNESDMAKQKNKIILLLETAKTNNSLALATQMKEAKIAQLSKESGDTKLKEKSESGSVDKFFNYITDAFIGVDMHAIQDDPRHPVIMISELGHKLSRAIAAATATVVVIGILSSSLIAVTQMFFGLPINSLVIIALTAEFVIPTLPYFIWIGALVGWLLLIVEAIIAAPLWAIMHLHPNGDDLTGRGGDGYKLVLSLIFRPVLMVFGMIGAILISSIIGEFINKTFYSVFRNSIKDLTGVSAALGLIMGLFLYVSLMFTFIKKTFGIIHMLPDQLMRWMGGSTGGLGDMANGFQDSAERSSQGAAALGGVAVGNATKGGAQLLNKAGNAMVNKNASSAAGAKEETGIIKGGWQKTGMALTRMTDGKSAARMMNDGRIRNAKGRDNYFEANGHEGMKQEQAFLDEGIMSKDKPNSSSGSTGVSEGGIDNTLGTAAEAGNNAGNNNNNGANGNKTILDAKNKPMTPPTID